MEEKPWCWFFSGKSLKENPMCIWTVIGGDVQGSKVDVGWNMDDRNPPSKSLEFDTRDGGT